MRSTPASSTEADAGKSVEGCRKDGSVEGIEVTEGEKE